jgi:hypothetical protein
MATEAEIRREEKRQCLPLGLVKYSCGCIGLPPDEDGDAIVFQHHNRDEGDGWGPCIETMACKTQTYEPASAVDHMRVSYALYAAFQALGVVQGVKRQMFSVEVLADAYRDRMGMLDRGIDPRTNTPIAEDPPIDGRIEGGDDESAGHA